MHPRVRAQLNFVPVLPRAAGGACASACPSRPGSRFRATARSGARVAESQLSTKGKESSVLTRGHLNGTAHCPEEEPLFCSATTTLVDTALVDLERDAEDPIHGEQPRRTHTPEARAKISRANRGNVPWNKGKKHTPETRMKIAMATRKAMDAPEVRQRMRNKAIGRKHSEQTKIKIRSSTRKARGATSRVVGGVKKRKHPVPFNFEPAIVASLDAKISDRVASGEGAYGVEHQRSQSPRRMSEETKAKLSKRIKEMWQDPEYRAKVRDGIRARAERSPSKGPLSEAHRKAISNTLRKRYAKARGEEYWEALEDTPFAVRQRNDPTAGTRLSDTKMAENERKEKDRRRKETTRMIEEKAKERMILKRQRAIDHAARSERQKAEANASFWEGSEDIFSRTDTLLESLAMAGQIEPITRDASVQARSGQLEMGPSTGEKDDAALSHCLSLDRAASMQISKTPGDPFSLSSSPALSQPIPSHENDSGSLSDTQEMGLSGLLTNSFNPFQSVSDFPSEGYDSPVQSARVGNGRLNTKEPRSLRGRRSRTFEDLTDINDATYLVGDKYAQENLETELQTEIPEEKLLDFYDEGDFDIDNDVNFLSNYSDVANNLEGPPTRGRSSRAFSRTQNRRIVTYDVNGERIEEAVLS